MQENCEVVAGIDLGTNNSCIAVYKNDKYKVLPRAYDSLTPSVVYISETGETHVGERAKDCGNKKPERMLYDMKRMLSLHSSDQIFKNYKEQWEFETKIDPFTGYCNYKIDGKVYTPEEIIAEVFKKLVSYVKEEIAGVVITVPAYFSSEQKNKLLEAAKLADLHVLQLVSEPTAAAIAYGMIHSYINGEMLFVFDMGSENFDITIINILNSKDFKVIALGGDSHLGGRDFDHVIFKYILNSLEEDVGKNVLKELTPRKKHKMNEMANEAKEALSEAEDAIIQLTEIHLDANDFVLTRQTFEELSNELIARVKECIINTLKCFSLNHRKINHVLFVGGASKMPMISKLLEEIFNEAKFSNTVFADQIVALGATIFAATLRSIHDYYIGICPSKFKNEINVVTYNICKNTTDTLTLHGDLKDNFNSVLSLLKDIRTYIRKDSVNFAKICFLLDESYNNVCRNNLINAASEFGCKKAHIIDQDTSEFLETMFCTNANDKSLNNVTIWIFNGKSWNIWQIIDHKASFITQLAHNFYLLEDGTEVINKYKYGDNIICVKSQQFEITPLIKIFPNAQFFIYQSENGVKGTILFCKILANEEEYFQVKTVFNDVITVIAGSQVILKVGNKKPLPFKHSIHIKAEKNDILLSVWQKELKEKFWLLNSKNYIVEMTVDSNGIYTLTSFEETLLQPYKTLPSTIPKKYMFPPKSIKNDKSIFAVGIDFGNTTCFAGVNQNNGFETVALGNTIERELLSYVSYDEMNEKCGKVVVGRLSWHSKATVYDIKKIIGKKIADIQSSENWPFRLVPKIQIEVQSFNGRIFKTPEEILAELYRYMKSRCEDIHGRQLYEAAVTVPINFSDDQINAIKESAHLAGWTTVNILPDAVAATFAYFAEGKIVADCNIVTFDLGGSSLQICFLKAHVNENQVEVVGCHENANLGGKDFDIILKNHIQEQLKAQYQHLNFDHRQFKFDVECEVVKKDLSYMEQREYIFDDEKHKIERAEVSITRDEFEELSHDLVERIGDTINTAMNEINVDHFNIDMVLQVGGGCRMPMIKDLLCQKFPKAEHCCLSHPEEIIALGATRYAYDLIVKSRSTNA